MNTLGLRWSWRPNLHIHCTPAFAVVAIGMWIVSESLVIENRSRGFPTRPTRFSGAKAHEQARPLLGNEPEPADAA